MSDQEANKTEPIYGDGSQVEPTPAEQPEAPAEDEVRVSLAGPIWIDAYQASGTLSIDRNGVLVPEADVASLVQAAGEAGIALKVG